MTQPTGAWTSGSAVPPDEVEEFLRQMASPRALVLLAQLRDNPEVETVEIEHHGIVWRWEPFA